MIDPILGLSFNLHSQKGTYALLLGSGVSRSADIPTGWEVTLDLVRKVAHMEGDECEGREADWYLEKYGAEPNYSTLLESIAPTSAAQQQVLRGYFEPNEEEQEEQRKTPTAAHQSIAQLVASGHFRVIVTTNFDRLLESALEAIGIAPVVVASLDDITGMPPLAHTRCTIIKVHGDYLDHRIRNSSDALAKYEAPLNKLLDQVWDEYGLVVCGWSADFDTALRSSIKKNKSRRYPTYWVTRSEPKGAAKNLVSHRSAQVITSAGADEFFPAIADKVAALEDFDRPHPLSVQAAVASLKRYLSEDRYRIRLHELLSEEAINVRSAVEGILRGNEHASPEHMFADFVARIEAANERLVALLMTGSIHARGAQTKPLGDAFQVLSNIPNSGNGLTTMLALSRYPALLATYAIGLSAVLTGEYGVLREIAYRSGSLKWEEGDRASPERIHSSAVGDSAAWNNYVVEGARYYVPVSHHLEEHFYPLFARQCPDKDEFMNAFDSFELLWGLLKVEAEQARGASSIWPAPGSYLWRDGMRARFGAQLQLAAEGKSPNWPPLKAGLFGGSHERLKVALDTAVATFANLKRHS